MEKVKNGIRERVSNIKQNNPDNMNDSGAEPAAIGTEKGGLIFQASFCFPSPDASPICVNIGAGSVKLN